MINNFFKYHRSIEKFEYRTKLLLFVGHSFTLIKNYSEEHIVLNLSLFHIQVGVFNFHYVIFVSLQFIRSQT